LLLGIVLTWTLTAFSGKQTDAAEARSAYKLPRRVTYAFTLQNTGPQLLENAEFRTYAPVKQTAGQRCNAITASHPFEVSVDGLGNQVLNFKLEALPPYAARIIRIAAKLGLSERPKPSGQADPSPWFRAEKYIEADHPAIRETARRLKASETLKTAENISSQTKPVIP